MATLPILLLPLLILIPQEPSYSSHPFSQLSSFSTYFLFFLLFFFTFPFLLIHSLFFFSFSSIILLSFNPHTIQQLIPTSAKVEIRRHFVLSYEHIPSSSIFIPSSPSNYSPRKKMAFLGQLQSKLQEIKTQAMPQVSAVLEQANQATSKARQNLMPVLNKCTQQLDTLGKILQANVSPKQSPIDLVPAITAFDPALEKASFRFDYDDSSQLLVQNLGPFGGLSVRWPPFGGGDSQQSAAGGQQQQYSLLTCSFLPDQQFQLEQLLFHWGTEPMNGSLHTVAGVGYAGEMHFLHRNTKFPNMAEALKHPEEAGVVAIAIFLNETHDDNTALIPLTNVLSNVTYAGTECPLHGGLRVSQLISMEKSKEFWLYDGSETVEPFRETVKWVVCRSAVPISSHQLEKLRHLRKSRQEDEAEQPLLTIRPPQPPNSRMIRASFKSAAQAELPK